MVVYEVKEKACVWITLKDSTRLAAKLWIPVKPNGDEKEKFPAILEYLPYRRNDLTAIRDHKRHPLMCSQGYVMIRVDMRGSGDSDGFIYGEYEQQEMDDCMEIIEWIRKQEWCSGNVGMVGKSWGGFNGLQIAAMNPEGLKAIVSVCSTDDRYDDNSHYKGGCMVASAMLSWSSYMLTFNMPPPDPQFVGAKWKDMWLERLKKTGEPWVNQWLSHQARDQFWKHGSICEDYDKVKCAVFLIGGWADCYHNAIFRMAENFSCDWRALIGPWPHEFPDLCVPGPTVDYSAACLKFWDYHLKGMKNGWDKEPRLRLYLEESVPMSPNLKTWPGRWIVEDRWPSPNVSNKKFQLRYNGLLQPEPGNSDKTEQTLQIPFSLVCGSTGGCLFPGNDPAELALDQAQDDGLCRCWQGDVTETMDILGAPSLQLEISCDKPQTTLCARLVDVFPGGQATLISIGVLNLTHRNGHSANDIKSLNPGERYVIQLDLDVAGYTILAGHQLRLALSQSHWPNTIWPPPFISILQLHFISPPVLTLPIRHRSAEINTKDEMFRDLGEGVVLHGLELREIRQPSFQRRTSRDVKRRSYKTTLIADRGEVQRVDNNLTFGVSLKEEYDVIEDDPLSAKVTIETNTKVARTKETGAGQNGGLFDTFVNTKSTLSADEGHFYSTCAAKAWCGDEVVFQNEWNKVIPRFHV